MVDFRESALETQQGTQGLGFDFESMDGLTWLLCPYDPTTVLIRWVSVWIARRCNLPSYIIRYYIGSTC